MIENFFVSLCASVVFFVLGYFFSKIKIMFLTRNIRHLWKHYFLRKKIKVVLSTRPGPHKHSTPRVSFLEMKGFVTLSNLLTKFKFVLEPCNSEDKLISMKDDDLIILGGPIANKVSSEVWSNLSSRLPCQINLDEQIITIADRTYKPLYDDNGYIQTDYAIILRTKHPYNTDRVIFLCFGCRGFGTLGAIKIITNNIKIKNVEKK